MEFTAAPENPKTQVRTIHKVINIKTILVRCSKAMNPIRFLLMSRTINPTTTIQRKETPKSTPAIQAGEAIPKMLRLMFTTTAGAGTTAGTPVIGADGI